MKTNLIRKGYSVLVIILVATFSLLSASAQTQLIQNGGFESGSGTSVPNWTLAGGAALNGAAGSSQYAHGGSQYLILGGAVNENDSTYQAITVPSGATPVTLSFWYSITSQETAVNTAYDTMTITIRNSSGTILQTIATYSNLNKDSAAGTWHQVTANLAAYAGQTIQIYFSSSNDSSLYTTFRIDDVSVLATTISALSITSTAFNPATATIGTGYAAQQAVTATGGQTPYSWSASGFPSGMAINSSTGAPYGTPTVSGTFNVTVTVTDSSSPQKTASKVLSLTVVTSCSYSLSSSSASPGSSSGSSSFTVTTGSSCTWSAASDSTSWLTASSSGTGNGTVSYSYTANTSTTSRTGHITVGGQTFTVTQAATTTSSSPLSGKGDWIHKISSAIAAVPGATTIQDLINYEQSIGVKYLIVKAGEGDYYYPASGTKLDSTFVSVCHAAGIKVFGFHYVYGGAYQGRVLSNGQPDPNFYNENSSVNTEVSVAIQILDTGCDGLVIDGESAYEDFAPGAVITPGDGDPTRFYYPGTLPPSPSLSPVAAQSASTAAQAYCSGILSARPTAFLAHAPFFNPSGHPYFPYITFGKYCAAVIPQDYYRFNGLTPETTVADMDSQWTTLQNSWISSGHSDSVKPIFPAGYSASPVTGADITDFVNLLNTDALPATSGGYQGASFYDTDLQTSGIWSAIASATIGSTPNPDTTPPTISAFSVTPSSISVGSSFSASYTVSDSGGSGLKQVVLRRTSGDGSSYDPGWQDIQTVTVTGNGPVSGSFNPDTPPSAGTYWYGMAAFDNANNSKDERASGLGPLQRTVTTPDTTPPTVSITSPSSGTTYTTAQSVLIIVFASDNVGLSEVDYYDGATFMGSNLYGPYAYSWAITSANNGTHNWTARASDTSGNISISSVVTLTVNIDTTSPALTIASPLNNATVTSASLSVSGTASDSGLGNNGISSVTVNGVVATGGTASGANTANWSATVSLNSGANTVTVVATDGVGNPTQKQITVTYNSGGGGSSPMISSPKLTGTTFTLSVPTTQVGFNYTLGYKNSFSDANWTTGQTMSGTGGTITLTDTTATGSSRLYHVRVQ